MKNSPVSRIWNKMYTCAFIANFMLCVSQFIVNPLVATYAGVLGADSVMIGVISGLYFGVAFAVRPFSGPAITKLNKKYIMLAAYALGCVVNVIYALSNGIPLFVTARILHGVQFAFIGSLNMTLASDSLPPEKLGSGLGLFGVGGAVATAIAPSLGISLRAWGETLFASTTAGYTIVFSVAAACMLISIIPCLIMPYKPLTGAELQSLGKWYKNIIATEAILPAVVVTFYSIAGIMYTIFMEPFAREQGIGNIGLFFTVYAIAILAARPLCGRLVDKYGTAKIFFPSSVLFAASFLITGTSRMLGQVLVGAALAAIGYGSAQPALQTMCMRSVAAPRRGVASNTNYFGMDFGYFIGPTIGGFVIARTSHASLFTLTIIPVFIAVAIFAIGLKPFNERVMKKRLGD
ncbi:MAG: MFS transporter [Oscillospiraceae bacterium]|nr:MFS transporter [Oscillospiraceae bacterium]